MNFDDIELRLRYPQVFRQAAPQRKNYQVNERNSNEVSAGATGLLHLSVKRKCRSGWLRVLRRAPGIQFR